MVATLFSISRIMFSLAQDGDAPPKLAHINSRGIAIYALPLSATGLALTILLSFFLPARLYEADQKAASYRKRSKFMSLSDDKVRAPI